MFLKLLGVSIVVINLYIVGNVSVQEKEEKPDTTAQAKTVSEQFAKVMFVKKDLPNVMKIVAVPFVWPYDDSPKPVDNIDDLKKKINGLFSKQEAQEGTIKIHGAKKYEIGDPALDKIMKKGDVIVGVSITSKDAEGLNLFIMVASRGGQPKVVSFAFVPTSAFEELKKKNQGAGRR